MCMLYVKLFSGLIFTVYWKRTSLWFRHFLCFIVLLLLHLSLCFVSLWLIPHPTVAIKNLRIHGIMCVCVCMYVCMLETLFLPY